MSTLTIPSPSSLTKRNTISVVHVVHSLEMGGLERVVLALVRQGKSLDQHLTVICLSTRGALADEAEAAGIDVIELSKRPGIRLDIARKLANIFRQTSPDVVHTHQIGALFYVGPAARWAKVPVVVHTEHGKNYGVRFRTRILGQLSSRFADRFFCVSEDLARDVRRFRVAKESTIAVVPNGIDVDRFRQHSDVTLKEQLCIPKDSPIIGTIGRLAEIKRQDLLIRAFAILRKSIPGAHLLIVGDGPRREELISLAQSLDVASSTRFVGYQSQPQQYLLLMNVFAITSRSEGMPLAVLEAWAASVPVVASAVGGLPEMIDEGQTGFLFPSGDEDALAKAILTVLQDPSRAELVGKQGLTKVLNRFSVERMASEYHQEYMTLLLRK